MTKSWKQPNELPVRAPTELRTNQPAEVQPPGVRIRILHVEGNVDADLMQTLVDAFERAGK